MKKLYLYGDIAQACYYRALLSDAGIECTIRQASDGEILAMNSGREAFGPGIEGEPALRVPALAASQGGHLLTWGKKSRGDLSGHVVSGAFHVLGVCLDEDFPRALCLMNLYQTTGERHPADWLCLHCLETVPGRLLSCWHCGEFHGGDD